MAHKTESVDVLLVGAGIMSATLATLLKELDPQLKMALLEQLPEGAAESSNPWNNAGTGHAGLCEMNYTPEAADGSVSIAKAVQVNSQFEVSKQFWAHLTGKGLLGNPCDFIRPVQHLSFVRGDKDVDFLRTRYERMSEHHAFAGMEYSECAAQIAEWVPLMMSGRDPHEKIAATRFAGGSDINFGRLTLRLLEHFSRQRDCCVTYCQRIVGLVRVKDGWSVTVKNPQTGVVRTINSRFVFLGGGGGALPLLQMSCIPEGRGYGGFPVSGQWLRCDNPEVVKQHYAKAYSRAEVGAPPMSVPHLDARVVDGATSLLFGPFAGFSTKFLKHGSYLDLFKSIRPDNIAPMLAVARDNLDLTRYLVKEVRQSDAERFAALKKLYPAAQAEDWRLEIAGQRVQIIKRDPKLGGVLQFGTEVVSAQDGSIAALLGASPGASVSVPIMVELIERCFKHRLDDWRQMFVNMLSAREKDLQENPEIYASVRARSNERLGLL